MRYFFSLLLCSVIISCSVSRPLTGLHNEDRVLADSMLAYALDHEAVYTLLDTIKPVSSVKFLRFPVAKTDSARDGDQVVAHADSLPQLAARYARICRMLSGGDHQFVMMPFAQPYEHYRNVEIYAVRKSRFAAVMRANASFFGQWGFTAESDPAVVLPVIEYEARHDRNRGYGLLFGYPLYAVDFFVSANQAVEKDTTIKLVPRDFFAIPVFAGEKGHFTYAIPKDHQPGQADSLVYRAAMRTLDRYKTERAKFQTPQGFRAMDLWRSWGGKE